jgi:hypothetical protein
VGKVVPGRHVTYDGDAMDRSHLGTYLGTVIGCLGWWIGLAAVCIASGETGVLGRVAWPGIAVSLGIAATFLVTSELALAVLGRGTAFRLVLWGELAFFVGVLILLVNHWIAPLIDASPDLRAAMGRLGGCYRTGDAVPAALMTVGAALLAFVLVRRPR